MNSNIVTVPTGSSVAERNSLKSMVVMFLGIAALGTFTGEASIGISVVLLSTIVSIRLWNSVGRDIGIVDLTAFIAVLQWIMCPYVAFQFPLYQASEYAMSGSPDTYFTYAIPGTAMFLVGINLVRIWYSHRLPANIYVGPSQVTVAFVLVGIALVADIVSSFSPTSIQFALKVLSDLKFGAMVIFLYSRHQMKWLIIGVLAAFIMLRSRNVGMFHETLLWVALFTIYAFYRYADPYKPSKMLLAKVAVLVFGSIAVISLQLVKSEFRTSLARGDKISLVRLIVERALDFEQMTQPESLANVLVRFNQGWIISRIIDNIPHREPFQNGKSFATAAEAVLMPRVLFPSRPPVEMARRFYQFTGIRINDTTCMGISFLGETYGNFGRWGGIFAMVLLGMVLSASVEFTRALMHRWPLIFFLLGVIFSEPMKAETDSTMVLNYIAKSAVVVITLVYLFRQSFTHKVGPLAPTHSDAPINFRPRTTSL